MKRSRNAAPKPAEPAKRKDKGGGPGGKNAWTDYLATNFAAMKTRMMKEGIANPSAREVQAQLLPDYRRMKAQEKHDNTAGKTISLTVATNMFNGSGGAVACGGVGRGGGGGGGGDGGTGGSGGGGVAGSEDAKDGEVRSARKANKALKRKLKEAQALVASLVSTGSSAAQTDAQARAGVHSAQRADQVSATAGASTSALSPSPPDSVKKLKRSIAGLNRAADYHQDSAHMQRLGELEYELSERIRKKKKYGTWVGE